MELSNNVIYQDEDIYGFLPDLIQDFKYNVKECELDEYDAEVFEEAIKEMEELYDNDDADYIYHVWYNPMGAYIIKRMVEER